MNLRLEEKNHKKEKLRGCVFGAISGNAMCEEENVNSLDKCWPENLLF